MATERTQRFDYVTRAKALPGWRVRSQSGGAWVLMSPDGVTVAIHSSSSDVNARKSIERELRATSFFEDEKANEERRQKERDERVAAEAKSAAAALAKAEKEAMARFRAAGGTVVTVEHLIRRHPVPTTYSRVLVTPTYAARMLEANVANRPIKQTHLRMLVAEMAGGRWLYAGEPYRFSRDGELLDGQHRLRAQIETGTTLETDVICGLDPATFHVIDTGAKRTSGDVLYAMGVPSGTRIAAIVRTTIAFETEIPRAMWNRGTKIITNGMIAAILNDEKVADRYVYAANMGQSLYKAAGINTTGAGAFYYLAEHVNGRHPKLLTFVDSIREQVGLNRGDPVHTLVRVMRNTPDRSTLGHFAMICKAWNAYAVGRELKILAFRDDESVPSIFVLPPD